MKKIKIPADVGQKVQVGVYNGAPIHSYKKICNVEAYEIREDEDSDERTDSQEN